MLFEYKEDDWHNHSLFKQIFCYNVRVFRIDLESTTQLDVLHDGGWQRVSEILESYSRFHHESIQLQGTLHCNNEFEIRPLCQVIRDRKIELEQEEAMTQMEDQEDTESQFKPSR